MAADDAGSGVALIGASPLMMLTAAGRSATLTCRSARHRQQQDHASPHHRVVSVCQTLKH